MCACAQLCVCDVTHVVDVRVNNQKPQVTKTNSERKRNREIEGRIVSLPQWEAAQRGSLPQFGPPAEKVHA